MSLRERVQAAVRDPDPGVIDALVAAEVRALRYLTGMTYTTDAGARAAAARGIALAAKHHPKKVQELVRRLIWAMNDESGTNSEYAPEVIRAIAAERAEVLLPVVPDLVRLAADPGLQPNLVAALREVAARCPGKVGTQLTRDLNARLGAGDDDDND
jgi:2-hydroxychromene-2-carboxylate isomerase